MVRDGFPVQAQLKTASDPRSTSRDWGSVVILGPTVMGGSRKQGSWDPPCCGPPFFCPGFVPVQPPSTPAHFFTSQPSAFLVLETGSKTDTPFPKTQPSSGPLQAQAAPVLGKRHSGPACAWICPQEAPYQNLWTERPSSCPRNLGPRDLHESAFKPTGSNSRLRGPS